MLNFEQVFFSYHACMPFLHRNVSPALTSSHNACMPAYTILIPIQQFFFCAYN
jgi:hypothetical protein